ncbi:MAG: ABC transporter ATP-binding protein [Gemmatimonadales bacterium]|nr:ABC transporter ATP-binding protein [Gemmatimonadales bacterium]
MTTPAAVEIRDLGKRFRETVALDAVTLDVPAGSVFGFLGPNGAGKTTTIRILTGLAQATHGSARVLGRDVGSIDDGVRSRIGFLPDVPGFYEWMTGREFLRFAGRLFGLAGAELSERVEALLEMAGLASVTTRIGGYSRGMKQRLGVAQALINAPDLLFLDEPTSALDPIGRREVLEMIASLRGRTTVFFSTHILADVERVCDTVAILDRGRVVASASVTELKQRAGVDRVAVTVDRDADALARQLEGAPWLAEADVAGATVRLTVRDRDMAAREIPRVVASLGLGLHRLEAVEVSLEEVFVSLVGRGAP